MDGRLILWAVVDHGNEPDIAARGVTRKARVYRAPTPDWSVCRFARCANVSGWTYRGNVRLLIEGFGLDKPPSLFGSTTSRLSNDLPMSSGVKRCVRQPSWWGVGMSHESADAAPLREVLTPTGVDGHMMHERSAPEPGRSRVRMLAHPPLSAWGGRGAIADDARMREVSLRHSSWEAGERGRAID